MIALGAATFLLPGCAADSREGRAETDRQVAAAARREEEFRANPMREMLGRWVTDLDATMRENATLPQDMRDAIRQDLTAFPFELTITERDYASRSSVRVNADRYAVLGVDGRAVTIALSSADGVERGAERRTTLRLRDSQLVINVRGPINCVLSRAANAG